MKCRVLDRVQPRGAHLKVRLTERKEVYRDGRTLYGAVKTGPRAMLPRMRGDPRCRSVRRPFIELMRSDIALGILARRGIL
jgi:hypothetical protein